MNEEKAGETGSDEGDRAGAVAGAGVWVGSAECKAGKGDKRSFWTASRAGIGGRMRAHL